MFVVSLINDGYEFFLKSTTWTMTKNRRDIFSSEEMAAAALNKAKPFTKASLWKKAVIKRCD